MEFDHYAPGPFIFLILTYHLKLHSFYQRFFFFLLSTTTSFPLSGLDITKFWLLLKDLVSANSSSLRLLFSRGGVEDTRLEAKDTKKIRGQGQGHRQRFRGQTLSRPRTGMLEAKDQGH